VDRIITRLGLADHEPTVLHDRRGTTVYKIDNIALKINNGLMVAREGEILHLLGTEFYRDRGWDEQRSWLTLRWIEGTSLWTEFERAHRGDDSATIKGRMLALAAGAAQELAELHAAGWAHGDLQPDHVILEGKVTRIIDLACAQGPADVPFYVHRGGLAHTTAPEVADLILSSEEHITLTPEAEPSQVVSIPALPGRGRSRNSRRLSSPAWQQTHASAQPPNTLPPRCAELPHKLAAPDRRPVRRACWTLPMAVPTVAQDTELT
jgi:tRNA A-37 threonylcarbamoyl transferase component Bud32